MQIKVLLLTHFTHFISLMTTYKISVRKMSPILIELTHILSTFVMVSLANRGPKFLYEPQGHVQFSLLQGVKISCRADGDPVPNVQWHTAYGSEVSNDTNNPRNYQISHTDGESILVIPPKSYLDQLLYYQMLHRQTYRCSATNEVGRILSVVVSITLVSEFRDHATAYGVSVVRGNTAVLKCSVDGHNRDNVFAVDAWIKSSGQTRSYLRKLQAYRKDGSNFIVLHSGELLLFDATEESLGNSSYECQLKNTVTDKVITSNNTAKVTIRDPIERTPPAIVIHHPMVTAMEGEFVDLPCVAEGYPPPTYSWHKIFYEQMVVPAEDKGKRIQNDRGILSFRPALANDTAVYVCSASSDVHHVTAMTSFYVFGPLTVEIYPKRLTPYLEELVTFTCKMSQMSVEVLTWMKDGEPLELEGGRYNITKNILRIPSVRPGDNGMYQCFVSDNERKAQASSQLTVEESAPRITSAFPEVSSTVWTNVSMKCIAKGNPQPAVTWYIHGSPITSNTERLTISSYESSVEGRTISYLNITEVLSRDRGNYACKANNKLGSVSHSAMLNVNTMLRIPRVHNVTATVGEKVLLHCPYSMHSSQSVRWLKDGLNLPVGEKMCVNSDGLLCVGNLEMDIDEGKYECDITTEEDVATGFIFVTVISDPTRERCWKLKEPDSLLRRDNQSISKCPERQLCVCNAATKQLRITGTNIIFMALLTLVDMPKLI